MATSQGCQFEFIGPVSDDLYCKKCTLVARKLSISTCCGESFCQSCLADTQEQGKPCPVCGEKDYNIVGQVKSQKRISCLQVYCSMKERGCDWSGTLEQLDTHLDPDQDNCQYVDTKCPLNCHMTTPKNKVEQHVAQHCAKRPYFCQHCSFKATYEEVVDTHLPECKYIPLQCPNLCGVTFQSDFMEDHMKMCRLEEIGCDFSGVGCDGWFRREDQEEHTKRNSQKHLTLTASLAVETKEQFKQKIEQQEKQIEEQEKKLTEQKQRLVEQEKKLEKQNMKLKEQEKKLLYQENKRKEEEQKLKQKIEEQNKVQKQKVDEHRQLLEHMNSKFQNLEQKLKEVVEKSVQIEGKFSDMFSTINRRFEMKNFSHEKAKNTPKDWKTPAMYTHVSGYKFCIGVDANGYGNECGKAIDVSLWSMPGEYDDQLKWPAKIQFTIELLNQQEGGENASHSTTYSWKKPTSQYNLFGWFFRGEYYFMEHSKLNSFLNNDTLYFCVSEIIIY